MADSGILFSLHGVGGAFFHFVLLGSFRKEGNDDVVERCQNLIPIPFRGESDTV